MTDPLPTSTPAISAMVIERGPSNGSVLKSAQGAIAKTPGRLPDLLIATVTPFKNIVIRGARTFIQTVLGLLAAGMAAPKLLPADDFYHLLLTAASLSVAATVVSILQNTAELLGKWDQSNPVLRG